MRAERGRVTLRQKRGGRYDRTGGGNKVREVDWTREPLEEGYMMRSGHVRKCVIGCEGQ